MQDFFSLPRSILTFSYPSPTSMPNPAHVKAKGTVRFHPALTPGAGAAIAEIHPVGHDFMPPSPFATSNIGTNNTMASEKPQEPEADPWDKKTKQKFET